MNKAALLMSLLLVTVILTGCIEAEYHKEEEPTEIEQSQDSVYDAGTINTVDCFDLHGEKRDSFSHNEHVLLHNDLGLNSADDIIAALGDPVSMEEDEGVGGHVLLRLDYEQALFFIDETNQVIAEYNIQSKEIKGPRGIRIGDSASAVIGNFYYEDEIKLNKPVTFADLARENEYFACLYQLDQDSKVGLVFYDKDSKIINRIVYALHYGPHGGVSWLSFECENSQVSSISFNRGY